MMRWWLLAALILAGVLLLASGWTDLDWMLVCNHYQFGQVVYSPDVWEFCPYLKLNWWLAFEFTLARIIAGALLLGFAIGHIRLKEVTGE